MRLRLARLVLGLAAALALLAGCAGLPSAGAGSHPIVETEVIADGDNRIFWADDESVLFVGYDVAELAPEEGRRTNALYLWNVRTGALSKVATGYRVGALCVNGGRLMYIEGFPSEAAGRSALAHMGWLGATRAQPYDKDFIAKYNRITCDLSPRHWEIPGRITYPLQPEHGYLDFGPLGLDQLDNLPARLVGPGVPPEGVVLPFGRWDFHLIAYNGWGSAYVVQGGYFDPKTKIGINPWPPSVDMKIWVFTPDGTTRIYTFAYDRLRDTLGGLVLTRAGAFVSAGRGADSGLYRVEQNGTRRVLAGVIGNRAVSPDGCRIAAVYSPSLAGWYDVQALRRGERPRPRVIAIDVCVKEGADVKAR